VPGYGLGDTFVLWH